MQKTDADNIKELYEEVKDSINISAGSNTYENDKVFLRSKIQNTQTLHNGTTPRLVVK